AGEAENHQALRTETTADADQNQVDSPAASAAARPQSPISGFTLLFSHSTNLDLGGFSAAASAPSCRVPTLTVGIGIWSLR
ncbi:unnamed protein product, partial [Urochloa humidicola]